MNSPHQREQLPDLLSDALDPTERARVESHLAECAECASELRALEAMQQTLFALPAATPPASLRRNVRAALEEQKKPFWALSLPRFARAKKSDTTAEKPLRDSERIGDRKALPFALPARGLAWGGAVAVGAVGLMLLAGPSLRNGEMDQPAFTSEADLVARADKDATESKRNAGAPDLVAGLTGNSATGKAPQQPAKNARSSAAGANASVAPNSVADLPPLPPLPTPRAATPQPQELAPIPPIEAPRFDLFPSAPPAPKTPVAPLRKPAPQSKKPLEATPSPPIAPPKLAAPDNSASATQSLAAEKSAPSTEAAPAPVAPTFDAPDSSRDSAPNSEMERALPAPMGAIPDAQRRSKSMERASSNAADASDQSAPPSLGMRMQQAPITERSDAASDIWPGGAVGAQLKRAATGAPILTLSVDKAIGDARLFLRAPGAPEKRVWRGSLNAVPLEIRLSEMVGVARSGQMISARLEQIDGSDNPKASTNFTLVWP